MGFRVFVTGAGIAEEAHRHLLAEGCEVRSGEPADSPDHIARKLGAFRPHALIVRAGRITAAVLDAAPALRVICKHGVGTDNIDIEAATARGIPVLFTPGANFESVAEHALALILALLRRVALQDRRIRAGAFDKRGYDGLELRGKTLGLVGFGRAGRRLCELVQPFGVRVLVYDPYVAGVAPPSGHVRQVARLEEVFAEADVLSLHCPLTAETRGMVNASAIARMKRGVFLVNTARGGLVDEQDLYTALLEGTVGGAALDVYEAEPPAPDHPLFRLDNVVLTAHVAGASDKSLINMGMQAAENVLAVLLGRPVDQASLVNPEALGKTGRR